MTLRVKSGPDALSDHNQIQGNLEEEIKAEMFGMGLSSNEGRIYLHLAKTGPQRAREVSECLSIHRTETYHLLSSLLNKGLLTATFQHPVQFEAVSFEKALNILTDIERDKVKSIERKRPHLLNLWRLLPKNLNQPLIKEGFQILGGLTRVYHKTAEMIKDSKKSLLICGGEADIIRLHQNGVLDSITAAAKRSLEFRIVTCETPVCVELLKRIRSNSLRLLSRQISYLPHFFVQDSKETLFMLSPGVRAKREATALWTNYGALVEAMSILFHELSREREAITKEFLKPSLALA